LEHLSQLRQRAEEFSAAGAEVMVVTFYPRSRAAQVAEEYCLPFRCLVDDKLDVYHRYGLGALRGSDLLSAAAFRSYGRALRLAGGLRGLRRAGRPTEDPRQAGGDFVVGPDGVLRLVHVTRHPGDRPAPDRLLTACREGLPGPGGPRGAQGSHL
jgi:hypothetical protein